MVRIVIVHRRLRGPGPSSTLVVCLAAALVLGGCGVEQDTASGDDAPSPTERSATAPSTPASSTDAATPSDGPVDRPVELVLLCDEPTPPIQSVDQYSGSAETLDELAGADRIVAPSAAAPPDSDGDGVPDEIVAKERFDDPAVVVRGDGRLELTQPGMASFISGVDDLDGDGRDELVVVMEDAESTESGTTVRAYLVPGSTPPGTHDPAEVGVRLATGVFSTDDRDGDGVPELIEHAFTGPTRVFSGAAVIALGPGGDATGLEPMFGLPGVLQAVADLGEGRTVLVTGEMDDGDGPAGLLHVGDEAGVRSFTTAPEPWVPDYVSTFGSLHLIDGPDGMHLDLYQSDRSAARAYRWALDAPCPDTAG